MPRTLLLALFAGIVIAAAAPDAPAAEEKSKGDGFLARALAREIIGPRQTLAEVADYCEASVPPMPKVASLDAWEVEADRMRKETLARVIFRGEAASWRDARTRVEWQETLEGGPGYRIKKLRYEALPGLWIPALLYEPETLSGKVPVILNVNGHDGKGKAADYKQIRCINQAKRGMIALNSEWFGMGQFGDGNYRHDLIDHIDLCGTSGIATHYLAMSRGLGLLLGLEHADPDRVAVTGLSGGGWQTIFISAFDTRVKLTNPVAGYSSFRTRARHFSDLGDSEQTPCDLATVTDYAQMTAMMAPRAALLTFNKSDDCCFASDHALPPLLEAAGPIYALYGKEDRLRSHVNTDPGTHNYFLDNRQAHYRMLGDQFYPGVASYKRTEIPSDREVKSIEALRVALPEGNQSLHSLAAGLARSLPLAPELPREKAAARSWRDSRRAKLREIVRPKRYDVRAEKVGQTEEDGVEATFWRLKVGEWSVPVVEFRRGSPGASTILLGDLGRKSASDDVAKLLASGNRVLAVDPFYVGEAKVAERDYLFALFLSAVGDRPLGLQASQIAAVARWAKARDANQPITVTATGPRTSTMALVAASLDDPAIDRVELIEPLGSLKELIASKASYNQSPELFCFGLLRDFDIAQLAALVAPRPLAILKPSERTRTELSGLKAWYQTWGLATDPLH